MDCGGTRSTTPPWEERSDGGLPTAAVVQKRRRRHRFAVALHVDGPRTYDATGIGRLRPRAARDCGPGWRARVRSPGFSRWRVRQGQVRDFQPPRSYFISWGPPAGRSVPGRHPNRRAQIVEMR
jgi:hypothetical protein